MLVSREHKAADIHASYVLRLVQAGNRRMSRPGFEAPAEPERHQRYSEHPFLLQKDTRNIPNIGKICLSFGVHPQVRDFRHHEDDRDTNNGRCKFVRDCRLHDGPDHTDPKPCRIRDRLDEQGRPVLHAAAENVPHDQINERKYIVIGKPDHKHHYRKPPPPFKGAGGVRVGWGRDDRVVDVNLGHGHGVFAHQQHIGPEGRLPFGQQQRKVPLTDSRRAMVRRAWAVLAGTVDSPKITRGRLLGCLKTRMLHSVVSQQQTEQQAQDEVLERMIGSSDPEQGTGEVTYQDFENFWQARSADITDDGYFALVLHNHFALK